MTSKKGNNLVLPDQQLKETARKLRSEYQRTYRKNNPERVRAWNERYWMRKAEQTVTDTMEPEVAED